MDPTEKLKIEITRIVGEIWEDASNIFDEDCHTQEYYEQQILNACNETMMPKPDHPPF